jgi:ATP-binding cassette subfamily B multidrug efflux pump
MRELLGPYLHRYRGRLAVGFLFTVLTTLIGLPAPWILKGAIDAIRAGASSRDLLLPAGLILATAVVGGGLRFLMRTVIIGVSRRIEYHLRLDIFDHLQRLPAAFFQENRTGDIVSRATNDLENLRLFLGPGLMNLVSTAVLYAGALTLMATLSPHLTLLALAPLPLATLIMWRSSSLFYRRNRDVQEAAGRMSAQAQEDFSGIRVVKSYVLETREEAVFRERNREYLDRNLRLARLTGFFHPLVGFVMGFATIVIIAVGGGMVARGELTVGGLAAFLGYTAMLVWPTVVMGWVVNLFQRGRASAARIEWILSTVPAIRDPEDPLPVDPIEGRVTFRKLDFSYPGATSPTLAGIDLEVPAGTTLALVGRTGSGKSTLVSLIPRLFEAPPGSVLIDGAPVERIPLALLRGAVGLVPQETFLFSESLAENIGIGSGDNPSFDPRRAALLAGLGPDLEALPDGMETIVGERGITLSGGQKQRVALARALARDPRILILDDAFASVDARTERDVLTTLRRLRSGRTVIIVTHRLSAVADADFTVVLDEGAIVERGTHAELLAAGGVYADLWTRQALEEEIDGEGAAP